MKYFTYILRSRKDNRYYVGITHDLDNRLAYHNAGKVRSTKSRVPFDLIYFEEYLTLVEARNREVYLKSYQGSREKMVIIENIQS